MRVNPVGDRASGAGIGPAEQRGGQVDLGRRRAAPAAPARTSRKAAALRGDRELVLGGAVDVVEHAAGQAPLGGGPQVVDVGAPAPAGARRGSVVIGPNRRTERSVFSTSPTLRGALGATLARVPRVRCAARRWLVVLAAVAAARGTTVTAATATSAPTAQSTAHHDDATGGSGVPRLESSPVTAADLSASWRPGCPLAGRGAAGDRRLALGLRRRRSTRAGSWWRRTLIDDVVGVLARPLRRALPDREDGADRRVRRERRRVGRRQQHERLQLPPGHRRHAAGPSTPTAGPSTSTRW